MGATFDTVRDRFFDRWAERHPEEASTLGIHAPGLSDPSIDAIEDEARELATTLAELDVVEGGDPHDRRAIRAWASHEVRRVARGDHLANVELGLVPYHLLRHFLVHVRDDRGRAIARDRAAAIPRYLAAHQRTLRIGAERGARACAGTIAWIAERTIPSIAAALRDLGHDEGAVAYEAHGAFLRDVIAPRARESGAIGRDEVEARLRDTMSIDRSPEQLIDEARRELVRAQEEMLACASRVLGGRPDLAAVRAAITARAAEPIDGDPIAVFASLVARATAFARAHELVPLADPLAVRVQAMPPAIAEAGDAQNWAAPLRDPEPHADFLVTPRREAHPRIASALLAVHEGVPGHSLQSLCFAAAHGRSRAPVRFLAVADDVAMARSQFGAMLSIEGWASWVEHRMLELGFYEGDQELYAWSVRALRACRVIADLSLHAELADEDDCAAILVEQACLPEASARREIARYRRIPLQALTYLGGALAVDRALARGISIDSLLAAGPVPPDLLAITSPRSPRPT